MSVYKCVFLDWAFTLSNSLFWNHFNDPKHLHYPTLQIIQAILFGKNASFKGTSDWMRGKLSSEEVVAYICQQNPTFDPQFLLQELALSCSQMQFVSPLVPMYVRQLQAMGIRVAVATDNMDTFSRWTVPGMRLTTIFDDVLNSYDLKALKMDRDANGESAFFGNYLRTHQIQPGESVLIDDGNEEYGQIIRSFGIEYRQIEPRTGLVPELQKLLVALN
ncbi:hypothetical protein KDW_51840 [Dictyobacter vulcani]|uniref:Haloacid dehalogenase n=1 Tax=Dictyobacter vulcani TaxID=2607529 RepID=A0A5J4KUZ8_9CHLR|nr:hypothetical protein [Dictyobacter vulcani]GER91022.1 hypothetical protein KDW_51840 [Dictyobacter vulcani]